MSFKSRSRARTDELAAAISTYHQNATTERLFDHTRISNLSEQTKTRNDPQVIQDLAQLDAEIKRVQTLQAELSNIQSNLGVWRAQTRNLLSPISMLPNELLGLIFTIFPPEGRELVEFTTAISSVSRLWRQVAMKHRSLWAVLDLRWHAAREEAWLKRAGALGRLSVYADFPGPHGEDLFLATADYRGLFRNEGFYVQSAKWVSVEFSCSSERHLFAVKTFIPEACKGLESITIIGLVGMADDPGDMLELDIDLHTLCEPLLHLTEVRLWNIYAAAILPVIPRLKVLKINTVGWKSSAAGATRRWMDIFLVADVLEDLETEWSRMGWRRHRAPEADLSFLRPLVLLPPYEQRIVVSSLRFLKLTCVDMRVTIHLASYISLPSLEDLYMEFDKANFNARTMKKSPYQFQAALRGFVRPCPITSSSVSALLHVTHSLRNKPAFKHGVSEDRFLQRISHYTQPYTRHERHTEI